MEKKICRLVQHCIAKMLVTTNPALLTVSQRIGSIKPLIQLVRDTEATDLQHFEALLSLTNLASIGEETKNRIVSEKGVHVFGLAMFSDHEMVRQAATEAMCNLVPHPGVMEHLCNPDKLRLWVAFASDVEENPECSKAASGCLAMASENESVASALCSQPRFEEMVRTLLECGNLDIIHRIMTILVNLIEHGGECKNAVKITGARAFCDAYVQTYIDGRRARDLKFSPHERDLLSITIQLAKKIASL